MIIARTPLRVSFFGGGTDLQCYCSKYRGAVIGSTIDKYIYHILSTFESKLFDHSIRINYSKVEHVKKLSDIKHHPFREILNFFNLKKDIEIHLASDLPAFSGLGSSSAFTVGLINSITNYNNKKISKLELAKKSIYVEQEILKESVGSQDQTFASYGGFNLIYFNKNNIKVEKIKINQSKFDELNSSLMLFYTGIKRSATRIEKNKIENFNDIRKNLDEILKHVDKAYHILSSNIPIYKFGELLGETWNQKKLLDNSVSNKIIDQMYSSALQNGAIGGKILGAGGGGFMLLFVPNEKQKSVRKVLKNFHEIKFNLDSPGSEIIYRI